MSQEKKFNCYTCEYRGTIPGNCHSCCKYPGTSTGMFDYFNHTNSSIALKLNIRGNPHGIMSGWFYWPINFDPVWLENCDGYKKQGSE